MLDFIFYWILAIELATFFGIVLALYIYLKLSHKFHWFDQPDENRKLHSKVVPTAAGLVFMLPVIILYLWSPNSQVFNNQLIGSVMLVLLLLGGWDDFKPISAKFRLVVILLLTCYFVYGIFDQFTIGYLLLTFYIIGLVWWLNLYNFMDGADGMAALHGIITAMGYMGAYAILTNDAQIMTIDILLFVFGLVAFLLFNFPKAKMFMGDAGSLSVAFGLSAFALYGIANNAFGEILVISFHLAFIVDATLTLLTRLYFKQSITQAHSLHLYQQLIHRGHSHAKMSIIYALATLLLVAITLYLHQMNESLFIKSAVLAVEIIILSFIWFYFQNKTKFKQFHK